MGAGVIVDKYNEILETNRTNYEQYVTNAN